ncbi:MAG: Ig-like domain-containing protein [Candidatus Falkowbacteria bacterium]
MTNQKQKFKVILFSLILIFGAMFSLVAVRAEVDPFGGQQEAVGNAIGLGNSNPQIMAAKVINWGLGFLGIIAVGIILYAGFLWMTSNGNADQVDRAKKILIGGLIGLIIILASWGIATWLVNSLVDVTGGGGDGDRGNIPPGGVVTFGVTSVNPPGLESAPLNAKGLALYNMTLLPGSGTLTVTTNPAVSYAINSSTDNNLVVFQSSSTCEEINIAYKLKLVIPEEHKNDLCFAPSSTTIYKATVSGYKNLGGVTQDPTDKTWDFSLIPVLDFNPPDILIDRTNQCIAAGGYPLKAHIIDDLSAVMKAKFEVYDPTNFLVFQATVTPPVLGKNVWVTTSTSAMTPPTRYKVVVFAYDAAGNSTSTFDYIIPWPAHCCNNQPDPGTETGTDCGGECPACDGAACAIDMNIPAGIAPNWCTDGNTLCASSFCKTTSSTSTCENAGYAAGTASCCTCQSRPMITGISPVGGFCKANTTKPCNKNADCGGADTCNIDAPNGATNNFITIFGNNFGTIAGNVYFEGNATGTLPSVLNSNCTSTWKDNQIIIAVPSDAASGTIIVKTAVGLTDTSSSSDSYGPVIKDFVKVGFDRPGICKLTPDSGKLNATSTYYGINFTNNNDIAFGSAVTSTSFLKALGRNIINTTTATATVPNLTLGKTSSFVLKNVGSVIVNSNYVDFTKLLDPYAGPVISDFNPKDGGPGQYVTIWGRGFGARQGTSSVRFASTSQADTWTADYNFPPICQDKTWSDKQIIIKVPSGTVSSTLYTLEVEVGPHTATADFKQFLRNKNVRPGICLINPSLTQIGVPVEFSGDNFKKPISPNATFSENKVKSIDDIDWTYDKSPNRTEAPVVADSITGPVVLVNNSAISNPLNLTVGTCKTDAECSGTGVICCPGGSTFAGSCATLSKCFEGPKTSAYEWDFTTNPNGNCQIGTTMCGTEACCVTGTESCNALANGNKGLCSPIPQTCSGMAQNMCTSQPQCPSSPGVCQTVTSTASVGKCGDNVACKSLFGGLYNYTFTANTCEITTTTASGANVACSPTAPHASSTCNLVNSIYVWQMPAQTSCPPSSPVTFKDINGKCTIGTLGSPSVCLGCPGDFSCNLAGKCVSAPVCAASSTCNTTSNTCIPNKPTGTCECCCRTAPMYAAQDCCLGLQCTPGLCGTGNVNYGQCTGCRVEIDNIGATYTSGEKNLSDSACNCKGKQAMHCEVKIISDDVFGNIVYDGSDSGTCKEGAPDVSMFCDDSTPTQCTTGGSDCVDPDKVCSTKTGCACEVIPCSKDTTQCTPDDSVCTDIGPDLECDPVSCNCTSEPSVPPGEQCILPINPTCTDGVASCGPPQDKLSCITSSGDCRCCCTPGDTKPVPGTNRQLVCIQNQGDCTGAVRGLFCGCQANTDCGNNTFLAACGQDTCCYPRPIVVSTVPMNNAKDICLNPLISVTFDRPMNPTSFNGNVILALDNGLSVCPKGLPYVATSDNSMGTLARWWTGVKQFFGFSATAASNNFCAIPGIVNNYVKQKGLGTTTILTFSPSILLDKYKTYRVIVKGDASSSDSVNEGVLSANGVSMATTSVATTSVEFINGVRFTGTIWQFTTGDRVCTLDKVVMDPAAYTFFRGSDSPNSSSTPNQITMIAIPESANGQQIVAVPTIYDWSWAWSSNDTTVVTVSGATTSMETLKAQTKKDGTTKVNAKAKITVDTLNNPTTANIKTVTGSANIRLFICSNPWPPYSDPTTWPWQDNAANCSINAAQCSNYNFELYYCRDGAAAGNTYLPSIMNTGTVIRGATTTPTVNDMLKEYYFLRAPLPAETQGFIGYPMATGSAVKLDWTASAVPGLSYKVYYGKATGNYTNYVAVTTNSTIISKLTNGQKYYFVVKAASSTTGAESVISKEISVTPKDVLAPPTVVFTIIPGDKKANLTWTRVADAVSYKVYYGNNPAPYFGASKVVGDVNSAAFSGLNNGTVYYFSVVALDSAGNESNKVVNQRVIMPDAVAPLSFNNVLKSVDFETDVFASADWERSLPTSYKHAKVELSKAEHVSGGQSVLFHKDANIEFPGKCSQALCNDMINPKCTWGAPVANACNFKNRDENEKLFVLDTQSLVYQNQNFSNYNQLKYNIKNLALVPGKKYVISFYYKGKNIIPVVPSITGFPGWSTQCTPKSALYVLTDVSSAAVCALYGPTKATWNVASSSCDFFTNENGGTTSPSSYPAGTTFTRCRPDLWTAAFDTCVDQPTHCCRQTPAQKKCFSTVNVYAIGDPAKKAINIPAGNYVSGGYNGWYLFQGLFDYSAIMDDWKLSNGTLSRYFNIDEWYVDTNSSGSDFYIDDLVFAESN